MKGIRCDVYMLIIKPEAKYRRDIADILRKTGVFTEDEVICALELFDAYIENEAKSGYHFL